MEISIVYWTGTGNTQMIAEAITDKIEELGYNPVFDFVGDADVEIAKQSDWLFLGSPAMTGEDIEEMEFRPFFEDIKESLEGKNVVLFGSFDWGGGEWINSWADEVEAFGGIVKAKFTVQWNPEDEQLKEIKEEVEKFFI